MPNVHKANLLATLRARFGDIRKLGGSESLYAVGNEAARIYIRYSRVHPKGRTFFGLREADLRQLEGHNAFLCFLLDDGSLPLFVPYTDFEEVFRSAQAAKDGQYKVQLFTQGDALELYVARRGRFNVEGYVGLEPLAQGLDTKRLRQAADLSHSQVQTLLAGIGHIKGFDVCVPESDAGKLDWSRTARFSLRGDIPAGFDRIQGILSEIDVVWIASGRNAIEGLFEVEHSTPIYSGLLRFNDVLLTEPKVSRFSIVSNDTRRAIFSRQVFRPTFTRSGLAERVSFLEYANVLDWHERLAKGGDA
ncbi:MAG: hypothetical protein HYU32_06750 [candidate division NC10 bacterium]|nr:hypothetical protein [candidate division NC10 bacterium]